MTMSSEQSNPDSTRSNDEDVMIPSSQESQLQLSAYQKETENARRKLPLVSKEMSLNNNSQPGTVGERSSSDETFVPFSRGTFEDGFTDVGQSQVFELRMSETQEDEETVNTGPTDSDGANSHSESIGKDESKLPESLGRKIFVRETSTESSCSAAVGASESAPGVRAVLETEPEEEAADEELTLTPGQLSAKPGVDLDASCSSDDITVVRGPWLASVPPPGQAPEESPAAGRAGAQRKRTHDDATLSRSSFDAAVKRVRTSGREEEAESPPTPPPRRGTEGGGEGDDGEETEAPADRTMEVVDVDEEPPARPHAHRASSFSNQTSPPPPSRPSSILHPAAHHFFVRFSAQVFNSVEQTQGFHLDHVVNSFELSMRNFNLITDHLSHSVCQYLASVGIHISPQSSLSTTLPSDDSVGYLGDRSSSSGGPGSLGIPPLARSSLSVQTFHGPPPHEGLRPSVGLGADARPASAVTGDPVRRSDVASPGHPARPSIPGVRRQRTGEWMSGLGSRAFLPSALVHLRSRRHSPEACEGPGLRFKVPEAPNLRSRSSASSNGSVIQEVPPPPQQPQPQPQPQQQQPAGAHAKSAPGRTPLESGYLSSNDLFDESGHARAASSVVGTSAAVRVPRQEEENLPVILSSDSSEVVKGPGLKDIDSDTNTKYSFHDPDVPVYARWSGDKYFYAGIIIGTKLSKEKYKVMFDDQSEADVRIHDIIMLELLPVGTAVYADPSGQGEYSKGYKVLKHVQAIPNLPPPLCKGYTVQNETTKKELTLARGRISVSRDAALPLLSSHGASTSTQISDLSLDNIIHTKRQAKEKQYRDSWIVTPPSIKRRGTQGSPRSPRHSGRRGGPAGPVERGSPASARKTGRRGMPSSASTVILSTDSTHTQDAGSTGDDASSSILDAPDTEQSQRQTGQTGRFYSSTGESLGETQEPGRLFAGFIFLVTGGENTSGSLTRADSPSRRSSSRVTFNRDYIRTCLEDNGGKVTDTVTEEMLGDSGAAVSRKGRPRLMLIAPDHNRTAKYLQCLAANVPCIRYTWVLDSCSEGVLQPLKSYRLPRGIDILSNAEVGWIEQMDNCCGSNIFENISVAIITDDCEVFGGIWERVLTLGGAIAKVLPSASATHARLGRYQWILIDFRRTSAFTVEQLRGRAGVGERIVNTEFVIRCLINARLFDPAEKEIFNTNRSMQK